MGSQFPRHVGTNSQSRLVRAIGVPSVVETETTIKPEAEVIITRGSDKGLGHVDLRHRSCRKRERLGEERRIGTGERWIVRGIEVWPHAAVGRRVRESASSADALFCF